MNGQEARSGRQKLIGMLVAIPAALGGVLLGQFLGMGVFILIAVVAVVYLVLQRLIARPAGGRS